MSKKENILDAALFLFANQGVAASSTRAIAKEASVSEGLVFKHFNSKEELLQSVLDKGIEQLNISLESILKIEHPKVLLKKFLSVPFQIKNNNELFWRFLLRHRWTDAEAYHSIFNPIEDRIAQAFKILEREDPKTEAQCFLTFFDAVVVTILIQKNSNAFVLVNNILEKFDLN